MSFVSSNSQGSNSVSSTLSIPFSTRFAFSSLYAPFHSHTAVPTSSSSSCRSASAASLNHRGFHSVPFSSLFLLSALCFSSNTCFIFCAVVSSPFSSAMRSGRRRASDLSRPLGASFAAFMRSVQLSNLYFSTRVPSLGSGFLAQRMRPEDPSGLVAVMDSFHLPLSLSLHSPSAPSTSPDTSHRPAPNMLHSLNVKTALAPVLRLFTRISPKVSTHNRPTTRLLALQTGGSRLYTSPHSFRWIRVLPLGYTSTQLPMNLVRTAEVRSKVQRGLSQWLAPIGGW
mmetsp:Transcript_3105/g.14520  ORF Transcript_3105/g.14520 Transcript_3105/m.14520 type:complete len:284 (-) Transcript_3105:559-1410(-)